jgi:hypothetical protein
MAASLRRVTVETLFDRYLRETRRPPRLNIQAALQAHQACTFFTAMSTLHCNQRDAPQHHQQHCTRVRLHQSMLPAGMQPARLSCWPQKQRSGAMPAHVSSRPIRNKIRISFFSA